MSQDFNGNFLHNIPRTIEAKLRIALEAISFSLDSIELRYNTVIYLLSLYGKVESISTIPRNARITIMMDIWSIIDTTHSIFQLIDAIDKNSQKTVTSDQKLIANVGEASGIETIREYHSEYADVIRVVRNKMDHLGSNLNKIANKKSTQQPLYGVLSYILSNSTFSKTKELNVVTITACSFMRENHSFPVINPADLKRKSLNHPVDHLQFSAFDSHILNITNLFEDSMKVRDFFNSGFADVFAKAYREHVKKTSISFEKLTESMPGEFSMVARGKMANQEEINELIKSGKMNRDKTG